MSNEIKNVEYGLEKIFEGAQDFLPLLGTDYVEFYVGNAKQAAHYYKTAFGFQDLAYAGLETGVKDRASYVLKQDKIRIVLTTALNSDSPIGEHVKKHGDGVKVIALWVEDARKSYEETTTRGAKSFFEPMVESDEHGEVVRSGIYGAYGETVFVFVERKNYKGIFMPGYVAHQSAYNPAPVGLKFIDHMVGNVDWNRMNDAVKWFEDIMGFVNFLSFDDKQITTEYSALMSKVMSNGNGRIKFPINEPAEGKKRSQIEEYINFYEGEGVQHLAVATDDIIKTVADMKSRGVEFLSTPPQEYYDAIPERLKDHMSKFKEDINELQKLGIMIDADEEGYLLQIFTKPIEDRPTLFFEVIQRMGAKGFGAGNFKALFESIEREQEKRGTL
ncbi:4-hydroxyphenylpyruvate dioxygenase [Fluviicola taffensis]|uniref:4-hydroxyphenylpyruvate dioxygenase n=1 Tax=Fluviicola taffensis (strain DSM 16823 / NCIMB 13979 / RW262) TaxID=755732 RepID=F2IJS3_FLUTR|nr:4-hydroxyphenylpyruvate dioxygenase [Fluviicola taffensis]AEA43963.1 4-hydroxyphenylpyruvate dioxygenase [Fluviicola taffensis DSM 16823]